MNRIRVTLLAGVLAVGGLGLIGASAHAQAPNGVAPAPTPRYYYGWGYNGWGYYYYPAAPSVPTRGGFFSGPARTSTGGSATSRPAQDYTGRHDGLYRPWLRPLQ